MTDRSRRTILCGTAGLFALSAGCLDEMDATSGNGEPDDGNGDGPSDNEPEPAGADGTGPSSIETYDAVPFTRNEVVDRPTGELFVDATGVDSWLADRGLEAEQYTDFVDDIAFDDSVLLALEAEAPQLNYELSLETVTIDALTAEGEDDEPEDGEGARGASLFIEAVVSETSNDGESGGVGGTQMISVGQLLRVTFDGEPLSAASVTIVDHDGNSHGFSMATGNSSESAPKPDEDD